MSQIKKIDAFIVSGAEVLTFPETLHSRDRGVIHSYCEKVGLFSKSEGNGNKRTILVYKKKPETINEITDSDRKQFIQYFGFPIPIYKEPYFSYYIETLDPIFKTKKAYALLVDAINILTARGENFKTFTFNLVDKIVRKISEQPEYQKFIQEVKNSKDLVSEEYPPETDIYNTTGPFPKFFFSLDINKANYNCMKQYNPKLVLDTNSWEEFIKKFTDIEYYIHAKYFRQIIFGKLCPKQIAIVQKELLTKLYLKIKDHLPVEGRLGTDELFVRTNLETYLQDFICLKNLIKELPDIWNISVFSLEPLGKSETFIIKDLVDGTIEIKNIAKDFYIQAFKYYKNIPLEPYDFKAMKDDYIITFDDPFSFS